MILAPRHLLAVGLEVGAGDVVVRADFGAADAGEERLGAVRAGIGGAVGLGVVDPLRQELVVKAIPEGSLIGVDRGAGHDLDGDGGDRSGLQRNTKGSVFPCRSRITTTTLRLPD